MKKLYNINNNFTKKNIYFIVKEAFKSIGIIIKYKEIKEQYKRSDNVLYLRIKDISVMVVNKGCWQCLINDSNGVSEILKGISHSYQFILNEDITELEEFWSVTSRDLKDPIGIVREINYQTINKIPKIAFSHYKLFDNSNSEPEKNIEINLNEENDLVKIGQKLRLSYYSNENKKLYKELFGDLTFKEIFQKHEDLEDFIKLFEWHNYS